MDTYQSLNLGKSESVISITKNDISQKEIPEECHSPKELQKRKKKRHIRVKRKKPAATNDQNQPPPIFDCDKSVTFKDLVEENSPTFGTLEKDLI